MKYSVLLKFAVCMGLVLTLACTKNKENNNPVSPPGTEQPVENTDSIHAAGIRAVLKEFQGDNPLPRSFIGSTANISDPYQKSIAEKGVIVYDLAMMLKALALHPEYNMTEIANLVYSLKNGTDIRSNSDFDYGTDIPVGHGYFYKIIDVRSCWLQDQTMPITGENAWIASAMASIYSSAAASNTLKRDAYNILEDLAESILALQTEAGYIRMAPKVWNNYGDVNFNQIVSTENNISVIPVFRFLAENATSQADKTKYQTALTKLRNALLDMYNVERGYFNTGLNLETGTKDTSFASDCQTWMILAFGVDALNSAMQAKYGITNTSAEILKTTLNLAGVQENGNYIGVDFSSRKTVVCYEWTLGFISAARMVVAESTVETQLKNATNKIAEYIKGKQTEKKILPYINSTEITDTQHGWYALPMNHLASSAWNIFEEYAPKKNPFDI
jgi:hypothetical protein